MKREKKKKKKPTTASNIRGYATPSMLHYALPPTALERSLHIGRWECKPRQSAGEKPTRADHCSSQGQNTPFVHFCARNPSQRRTRRSKKYENVPVHTYQPIRSHVINRSTHGVKSQCGFKHTLEAPCAAAQRLRTHAADTAAGLAHAGLALGTASAGR